MAIKDYDFPWIIVRKNEGEVIKVFLRKAQDGPYLDFRMENGSEGVSDRGITLDLELLPALIEALEWIEGASMEKALGVQDRPP